MTSKQVMYLSECGVTIKRGGLGCTVSVLVAFQASERARAPHAKAKR